MSMPTAAMFNPNVTRQWLEEYRDADPRAFRRECLAEFLDSVSGFLDADLVRASIAKGVRSRKPVPGCVYVAAMDPAFKRDSFAFSVGHIAHNRKMVFDVIKRWKRDLSGPPLDPEEMLRQVKTICDEFKIGTVFTDQHEITSLKALAIQQGLSLVEFSLQSGSKLDVFANLASLLNQRKLSLLDHEDSVNELLSLERKLTQGGGVQISAPTGLNDDLAMVIALTAQQAVWLTPVDDVKPVDEDPFQTPQEVIANQIEQKWNIAGSEWSGGWD